MIERLLASLMQISEVQSVALAERDGFVVFDSAHDGSHPLDAQIQSYQEVMTLAGAQHDVTFLQESGYVLLHNISQGMLIVKIGKEANLGKIRQVLREVVLQVNQYGKK